VASTTGKREPSRPCKLTVGGVLTGNIKKTSLTLVAAPDLTSASTPPRNARGGEAKGPVAARGGGRLLAATPIRSINKELAAAGGSAPVPGVQIAGGVATGMGPPPLHAAAALAFVALASYLINGLFSKWTALPMAISAAIVYNQQVSVCVRGEDAATYSLTLRHCCK
jgi:hypothetical protein